MIDLLLFIFMVLLLGYVALKIIQQLLVRFVLPTIFKNRIKEIEQDRLAQIQILKDMGVEFVSDKKDTKNYTSIW